MKISRRALLQAALSLPVLPLGTPGAAAAGRRPMDWLFVGTMTFKPGDAQPPEFGQHAGYSAGVYSLAFDPAQGRLGPIQLALAAGNPVNLILDAPRRRLYLCHGQDTVQDGQSPMSACAIEEDGTLRVLNTTLSGGRGPTHGVVDRTGRNLLTCNFSSSSVVCLRLEADGSFAERSALIGNPPAAPSAPGATQAGAPPPSPAPLPGGGAPRSAAARGVVDPRQSKPHCVILSGTERFALVAEIEADRVAVYRFDAAKGSLTAHTVAASEAGAGPRHLALHPSHRFVYSSDEAGSSITAWSWDEVRGELKSLQRLPTAPAEALESNRPAHVAVHPNGRFVYVSNRGQGTLAGFAIDARRGTLRALGETPLGSPSCWCFSFDRTGRWLVAVLQTSDTVVVFEVDPRSGALRETTRAAPVNVPTCVQYL